VPCCNIPFVTAADPWSVTLTSVVSGSCMGVTGIILVSSGLIAISLIQTTAKIIYILVGMLAGKPNCIDIHHLKNMEVTYHTNNFPIHCDKLTATYHYTSNIQYLLRNTTAIILSVMYQQETEL
jgi:hypothetical protein